jgi:hypothetical protein
MSRRNPDVELEAVVGYPALGRVEGSYEIEATGVTDVFAVNRDLQLDKEGDVDYRKTWNVTHLPTGYAVLYDLPTAEAAKAAVDLLEALGYGEITTDDPDRANSQLLKKDIVGLRSWLYNVLIPSTKSAKKLASELRKEAGRIRKGAEPPALARGARPKKAPKKAPPRRKKASKKKPPREPDLLAMVRKARGNPHQDVLETKDRLLQW